ncbi:MAG: 30S ribosomal protein S8 [Ignavibacteria bacterium]|nr:30S ribosomal protein S8 [Bacteroidota bacterium]MSQ46140.1 30S ribosomal protein S8 [Ignavibacteria bacterium]
MAHSDPIADYLTRIRNAVKAGHRHVEIPASNMKKALSSILLSKKLINDFTVVENSKQGIIKINLRYNNNLSVIRGLRKISLPGIRQYRGHDELPRVQNGLGIAIISTSKGLMTDKQARAEKVGGEVVCYVW